MPRPRAAEAGFALLEAMIALSILSGTLATVFAIVATARMADHRAEASLRATRAAEALLARVGLDLPLKVGDLAGYLDDGRAWTLSVTRYSGANADRVPLLQIRARVAYAPDRHVEFVTLRLPEG